MYVLTYYIAKDMQPLSTVDDHGFRQLLYTINPKSMNHQVGKQLHRTTYQSCSAKH